MTASGTFVPSALHQAGLPVESVLHSASAGVIVERVGQIAPGRADAARAVARELAEYINTKHGQLATAFVYEETFGTKDRLHWLLHFRSLTDYEALLHLGGPTDLRNGVFGGAVAERHGDAWNEAFVPGSVQETVLLPHRWGIFGTATEAMAQDPAMSPISDGTPPRFLVQPAQQQTSTPPERTLNTATAGVIMRRTVDFNYAFRAEARVFARTIAETVNLNADGQATVLLFEEPFGPMDRVHFLIHMKSLGSLYTLMGLDARTDPQAPRAGYIQDWISADKGGGSWDRIIVQGSTRDSALTPQLWR
ncbi:DUF6039 family protein [Saccharothrix sp. ST-888]|uniref:DUF6039 family protein n=1 Tax=Saccharothrix sp. ST-888 TaxID=1427391 RepID=UPI0005ECAC9B|nr:DUF6039 family protein [Saccharothrix sp. ST-888]KJK59194.1 hypothetical protein UK12_05800 [Saccharothrix sp. ST-888]